MIYCEQRIRIIAVEHILLDAKKPIQCPEIIRILDRQYNICASRKTLYDDIYALRLFYDVRYRRNIGYWIEKGDLNALHNKADTADKL